MSALGIIGLVWLGFGLLTIGLAIRMKLRPLLLWVIGGPLMGPFSLMFVAMGVEQKRAIPRYDDGSGNYGTFGG
ncbi:hypothetical protein FK535_23905 [Mycolicibacterium sp. 018/SC-01/001]|uniref:hypothetical protein n=1 Tax=Mycolicibacterium sp. 018/SC-01/001 TaxID=2592069 RepID=UPI00117EF7D6|nr:hypothetical protein [Mycolicibacterium sp. 018/SC-01/001]TRW78843.1 hypothetical protein FK535_23905 [Mycolicibacterium sp. 018/SC-01/001]